MIKPPIAYYFGTFNPVHLGHLIMAQCALEQFQLSHVVFVPAGCPPVKEGASDLLPAQQRLAMLELAIGQNPFFSISTLETETKIGQVEIPSYTANTLAKIQAHFPEYQATRIPFIIGSDALAGLPTWHQWRDVAEKALFLQALRPSFPAVTQLKAGEEIVELETTLLAAPFIGISSQDIRRRVETGKSIRHWVPETVEAYIQTHGLWSVGMQYPSALRTI